ncbi:uncharacterized protein LODBEIA_P14850 [Lodderomyces beijingensis]|uniref:RING-type E3 ubiquitin transferase n=1 Tax=Lodderomyces beijingensis TaxID=1775926 RepID=A0ABP0ZK59_9ASCO
MILSKTLQYILGYSALSVALLSWSIHDSLSKSYNYTMFLIEFTDGFKLGIFINFIVFTFLLVNKILQVLLFGALRMIEVEHLFEKLPIFAINLFLNLATGDNNVILNVLLMGIAMTFKVMHVIMLDRLDLLNLLIFNKVNDDDDERSDQIGILHIIQHYLSSINFWLNIFFILIDFSLAKFLVFDVFQGINSVTCLLFGFQFAVQGVETLTHFAKVLLGFYEIVFFKIRKNSARRKSVERRSSALDSSVNSGEASVDGEEEDEQQQQQQPEEDDEEEEDDDDNEADIVWESKPYYSKAIDISSALLTAVAYLCFIYLLTIHSGLSLPLSMLQGTYSSLKKAWTQTSQLLAFIESSKRLDSQLPNATKGDLEVLDNLCIICREDMYEKEEYQRLHQKPQSSRRVAKKLQCNHILHMGCLKEWMERSDSCPLCRRKVFGSQTPPSTPAPVSPAEDQPPIVPPEPQQRQAAPFETTASAQAEPSTPQLDPRLRELIQTHTDQDSPLVETTNADSPNMAPAANGTGYTQQRDNFSPQSPPSPTSPPSASSPSSSPSATSSSSLHILNIPEPTRTTPSAPTPTPPASTALGSVPLSSPLSSSPTSIFQTLRLPRNALLPPDWHVLPLERDEDGNFKVCISSSRQVQLRKRQRDGTYG